MIKDKKIGIIGAGGFAREVFFSIKSDYPYVTSSSVAFFVDDSYYEKYPNIKLKGTKELLPLSVFDPEEYYAIVAIGNPTVRKRLVSLLPENTEFYTYISTRAYVGPDVVVGAGSIICAGVIITVNVVLGMHTHLNLHSSIGHDTVIQDYFTTAPGARVSGNCIIGESVYLGTNSSIKEEIYICSNVTVGLNAGVVKNIEESGTYVGLPAKKIK